MIKIIKNNPIITSIIYLLIFIFLSSCNLYRPTNAREIPTDGQARARKNLEEGRGLSLSNLGKKSTNFEFASSNPMWRASLEILDFLPFATVDYSGGIIISDWYNDSINSNEYLKISIRFLSNEIRSDSINVVVHKKKCDLKNNCKIELLDSKLKLEIASSIIKKAAEFEKQKKK